MSTGNAAACAARHHPDHGSRPRTRRPPRRRQHRVDHHGRPEPLGAGVLGGPRGDARRGRRRPGGRAGQAAVRRDLRDDQAGRAARRRAAAPTSPATTPCPRAAARSSRSSGRCRRRTSATCSPARPSVRSTGRRSAATMIAATTLGGPVDNDLAADRRHRRRPTTSWRSRRTTSRTSRPATRRRSSTGSAPASSTNLPRPTSSRVEEIQDNTWRHRRRRRRRRPDADQARPPRSSAAGGPTYQWSEIDPVDDEDGGQPGGNIRVGRSSTTRAGSRFVDQARRRRDHRGDGARPAPTAPPSCPSSPGRVDPTNAAWTDSRKPLAGEFVFQGRRSSSSPTTSTPRAATRARTAGSSRRTAASEVQRTQQATVLNGFVKDVLAADPRARTSSLAGDFNDYQFSAADQTLTDDGATLTDLITTLPENQQYTYVFNGISQVLDHIFVSKPLDRRRVRGDPRQLRVRRPGLRPRPAGRPDPPGGEGPVARGIVLATPLVRAGAPASVLLAGWSPHTADDLPRRADDVAAGDHRPVRHRRVHRGDPGIDADRSAPHRRDRRRGHDERRRSSSSAAASSRRALARDSDVVGPARPRRQASHVCVSAQTICRSVRSRRT